MKLLNNLWTKIFKHNIFSSLICQFCQKPCQENIINNVGRNGWWDCFPCKVRYLIPIANEFKIKCIRFDIVEKETGYCLYLDLERQRTDLWSYTNYDVSAAVPVRCLLQIPYLLQNVTPTNALDKIKKLLLFS